ALVIKDGSTFVPLKEVVRIFGYIVESEKNQIKIFRPESRIEEIFWRNRGRELVVKMDKMSPYRIQSTDDPTEIILEVNRAVMAEDFSDGVSDSTFYIKTRELEDKARLQVVLDSKYPIPFKRDSIIEEEGENIVLKFLPRLENISWDGEEFKIEANDELEEPDVSLLEDPRRIVVDIPGLMLSEFEEEIKDDDIIKDMRVSQYTQDPLVLRVVLELEESLHLNHIPGEDEKTLTFKPVDKVEVNNLSYDRGTINFETDRKIEPKIFTLEDPERLVIDVVNAVKGENCPGEIEVEKDPVSKIRTSRFDDDKIRIVADLDSLSSFQYNRQQNGDYRHQISLKDRLMEIDLAEDQSNIDLGFNFSRKVEYSIDEEENTLFIEFQEVTLNPDRIPVPELPSVIEDLKVEENGVRLILGDHGGYEINSDSPARDIHLKFSRKSGGESGDVIVLDPGHGGFDPGAVGKDGLREKEVNLEIALQVKDILENSGYNVLMTREEDEFISLKQRVDMANEARGRIFISIHCNSANNNHSTGSELFVHPEKIPGSRPLAEAIYKMLMEEPGLADRGIKEEEFYVIKNTEMPAILLEIAFLSNSHEESLLGSDVFRRRVSRSIVAGIKEYINRYQDWGEDN
ncbi:MAG: N-acetylmuramoyl-L-alanine amidase, partial [Halanaerobiales bacterium]